MTNKIRVLSGTSLKIFAIVSMTIDHIGVYIFPQSTVLRIIGRLAFPIFAFLIAEGCRYTKSMPKYFLRMFAAALISNLAFYISKGSVLHQPIFTTFLFSLLIIFPLRRFSETKKKGFIALSVSAILFTAFICFIFPYLINVEYVTDYGFFGCLLPLFAFIGKNQRERLFLFAIGLCLITIGYANIQWFGLCALVPLALYNNKRGRLRLKYFFYAYYPLHIMLLCFIEKAIN